MDGQTAHLEACRQRLTSFKSELENLAVSEHLLTIKPAPDKWSAEECLQHLTVMWQTYKPQFDKGMPKARPRTHDNYKMGWFGKWFSEKMKPIESGGMKTSKIFEPSNYRSEHKAVQRLIQVQDEMLDYIDKLEGIDINKSRITSPASRLISLKMGDAFEIILNHQDRHWLQAKKAMAVSDPKD